MKTLCVLLLSAVAMGQQGVIGDPPPRMPCPANPIKGQVCYWDGYAWMQEPQALTDNITDCKTSGKPCAGTELYSATMPFVVYQPPDTPAIEKEDTSRDYYTVTNCKDSICWDYMVKAHPTITTCPDPDHQVLWTLESGRKICHRIEEK